MELKLPTLEDIHRAYQQGEEAVLALFLQVMESVSALAAQAQTQAEIIRALEARLGKDSRTSSQPPSSDGYGKAPVDGQRTKSLRKAGQKPNGGQPGHVGHTLEQTADPDHIELHTPEICQQCQSSLAGVEVTAEEERQVFDLPPIRIEVTAHRVQHKVCPGCGCLNRGQFPAEVKAPVQYGNGVRALAGFFTCGHHLPVKRTQEILQDLLGHRVSEAVLLDSVETLAEAVRPAEEVVKERLAGGDLLHVDETGMRVAGKLHWLHVASTDRLTHYSLHAKRGQEAMDEAGILPKFRGRLLHDHWKSYFRYQDCLHALCNSHHLRELLAVEKLWGQPWAGAMSALLCEIKQATEEAKQEGKSALSEEGRTRFRQRYDELLAVGYAANPPPPPTPHAGGPPKKGRPRQSPPRNLLDRLRDFHPQVLAFMEDFRVPFDNNQAERDVRMAKLKQKIAGCFRTKEGGEHFARIRGYLSTARKNGTTFLAAIQQALEGNPFVPDPA